MLEATQAAGLIADELRQIRKHVPGVRGSITATADGLVVAHDVHGLEPTQIAALVAATHAVAVRASLSTQCGQLKEVITRGTEGYLAVYSAGPAAIVAVLGVSDMNVAMLNFQARKMIEHITEHAAALTRRPRGAGAPAREAGPARDAGPAGDNGSAGSVGSARADAGRPGDESLPGRHLADE